MNDPSVIKGCKVSKHMTPGRCIKNQIEAEEIFGARASECNSCPCDIGLEIRGKLYDAAHPAVIGIDAGEEKEDVMAVIGKCENCERDDIRVDKTSGFLLCGSCRRGTEGTKVGTPEREQALEKVRERMKGKPKFNTRPRKKIEVEAKPKIQPPKGAPPDGSPPLATDEVDDKLRHFRKVVMPDSDPASSFIDKLKNIPITKWKPYPPVIPAEAGISLFVSHGSALSIGLRINYRGRVYNIISLSLGGRHENR